MKVILPQLKKFTILQNVKLCWDGGGGLSGFSTQYGQNYFCTISNI